MRTPLTPPQIDGWSSCHANPARAKGHGSLRGGCRSVLQGPEPVGRGRAPEAEDRVPCPMMGKPLHLTSPGSPMRRFIDGSKSWRPPWPCTRPPCMNGPSMTSSDKTSEQELLPRPAEGGGQPLSTYTVPLGFHWADHCPHRPHHRPTMQDVGAQPFGGLSPGIALAPPDCPTLLLEGLG